MKARMRNPALVVPNAMPALMGLAKVAEQGGVRTTTIKLVHLRASQINGCSVCVDMHARELVELGETTTRIFAVAAWRDTPFFSEPERAALALTESATRVADREEPVSDAVWDAAAKHYDEPALASLVFNIALINFWNRINIPTKAVALGRKWTPADAATTG